jgi:hypothetical protein
MMLYPLSNYYFYPKINFYQFSIIRDITASAYNFSPRPLAIKNAYTQRQAIKKRSSQKAGIPVKTESHSLTNRKDLGTGTPRFYNKSTLRDFSHRQENGFLQSFWTPQFLKLLHE